MDAVGASKEYAFERKCVYIIVDTDSPNACDNPMSQHKVDRQWYEETACEDRKSL